MSNTDAKADVAQGDQVDATPLSSSSQSGHFWKRAKRHTALLREAGCFLLGLVSLATVTGLYFWLDVPLVAVALTYLIVFVLLALVSNFFTLIVLTFIGVCCLSYFFAPPIYSARVDSSQDLITIAAFVTSSFVINFLVTRVRIEHRERRRAEQALGESEYKLRQIFETESGLAWPTGADGSGKNAGIPPEFLARMRAILDVLPAYSWYAPPSGSLAFVSKRQADFLGLPKDHPLRFGTGIDAQWDAHIPFLHPDDQEAGRKYWANSLRTGEGYEHSYRVRNAQGDYRWLLTRTEALKASDGTILLWIGATLDIEELMRAEEGMRESEYKLRQIIETIPSFVWSTDPKFEPTHVNQRNLDYYGLQFENFKRGGWKAFQHPDDLPETTKAISRAVQTGAPFRVVHRIRRADGEFRWHESRGEPLRDRQGNIIQWYGLSIDIDEGKKAEERLRRSEAHLTEAQRLSHSGVSAYNETAILYGSEETYRIWGFDPAQGVPSLEAVFQRVHPDDRDRHRAQVQRALAEKRGYSIAYRIVLPDGTVKHLESIGQPVFSASGELVEVIATQIDVTERKCAEEALRESEQRSRSAIDGIAGLVAIMAPNGELEALNRQVIEYFGRSLEEMKNWGTSDAVHPEDLPRIAELFQRSITAGTPFHYELRLRRFDGEYRWFDNRCVPIRDESGLIVRWYMLGTDVEDRKRAEQALRESEGKFRDYAETASDWFWEIGPDYKFTLLTENAFGSVSANRIGTVFWDQALDLETEPEKWRLIQATLDSREPFRDFVYCSARGDGPSIYVRASGKPVFDANGEFRGYRGTGADVTAIMRAQEALRESEQSARSAIDGIAGLVAVMTANGEVETVNRQCIEYFGRPLDEQKDWVTSNMVHPADLPQMLENFTRAIASEIPYHFEQRLRRFDGEYRWFDTRGGAVRDDAGRILRWYVLLTDIEDRTRALARLDQMQSDFAHMNRVSMMGELAAELSHEITQPIASARNNARAAQNFMDMQPPNLAEVREALSCVVGDTDRAGDMIDRIRDQMKKAPPRKGQFDLNDAIKEVIVLGQSAIIKNGVSVQTQLFEGLFPIHGDRVQLQQVVLNLLLNAVEAMGSVEAAPRDLLISTKQDRTGVLVAVRDSGPGLDPSHLERVFDAFYTTKSSGMGMGLSICRSIIEAHGGRLWAEANEPRGAVFQFTLPGVP